MTDYPTALAAAREAHTYVKHLGMTRAEAALGDLLAALDAAQGEAVYFTALPSGEYIKTKNDSLKEKGYRVVTAYLAPQAPPDLVTQLDHARRRIGQLTIQLGEVMKAPPAALAVPDRGFRRACVRIQRETALADAVQVVLDAMRADPEYAWSWHCNVVMAFVDEGGDHATANHAAARFMRLLANVEPAHELPAKQAQQPAAAVPERGLRDSVLNSAKFRAACYALVGIVEGIEGLGRNWAANGERLKDTREWVAFYNCVAAMRNGTFDKASAEQAPPAAVPRTHAIVPRELPGKPLEYLAHFDMESIGGGPPTAAEECWAELIRMVEVKENK